MVEKLKLQDVRKSNNQISKISQNRGWYTES